MNQISTLQTTTISYLAPRAVNIGDVFYRIEKADYQVFREPCIVCNGEKQLTVNGVTFKCPCCDSRDEVIGVCQYVVRRYRVYGVEQLADNDEWKASDRRQTEFKIYRKSGKGYKFNNHTSRTFSEYDLLHHYNLPKDDIKDHLIDRVLFDDYQLAISAAKALTDKELEKLNEYNAIHGTKHEALFEAEHDKKSR